MPDDLAPHFDDVQAHYDLSDDFFRLSLDPTQTYSCAYFERDDMTLEEAQLAKIDLALGKLGLQPGMTLLDVGCGWGAPMRRAVEKYDVNVVGLTLSKNQAAHVQRSFDEMDNPRSKRVLLLHTITGLTGPQCVERGIPLTFDMARFIKFIVTEIFPGGRLPSIEKVADHSSKHGFRLTRRQSLQSHYARTLDLWAAALEA